MTRRTEIPVVEIPRHGSYPFELTQDVFEGLRDIGFLCVKAPGIEDVMRYAYRETKRYFDLPFDVKMRHAHPEIFHQRGYLPCRQEIGVYCRRVGKGRTPMPDEKESYMMGPVEQKSLHSDPRWSKFYHENQWPVEAPGLKDAMTLVYMMLCTIGQRVLSVLEEPLGKCPGYFEAMLADGPTVMRALHYPPLPLSLRKVYARACKHKDINLVTVLPPSTPGPAEAGLWLKRRFGTPRWMKATAPPGYVFVQSGLMLEKMTDGLIKATIHEVRSADDPKGDDRLSFACFMHPASDQAIHHSGLLAGEYLEHVLHDIGLAEGVVAY